MKVTVMQDLCYHTMEPPDLTRPDKPMRGYFDLGDGNILPCGLTETEQLQAVKDSKRRTRDELSARLRARCADLRSQRG